MKYSLTKTKYLNDEELKKLLKTLDGRNSRDALMLKVKLATGARAQELLNIKKCDVSYADKTVLIHGIKGSNDREIPLKDSLFVELTRYMDALAGEKLFEISYSRLVQIWDLYRPVKKKLHSIRHTFAIELYKKTKDLRLLQVALGHKNILNTMIYSEYVFSKEELRKIL